MEVPDGGLRYAATVGRVLEGAYVCEIMYSLGEQIYYIIPYVIDLHIRRLTS